MSLCPVKPGSNNANVCESNDQLNVCEDKSVSLLAEGVAEDTFEGGG